jgi:hypothetical protein
MSFMRPAIPFLIAVLLLSGCQFIDLNGAEVREPKSVAWVADCRSIPEVDAALAKLIKGKDAQANVEALLNGWGKHGDWYDLAVVKFLWEHWPSGYGDADVEAQRLIPIVKARIEAKPELNRQIYWYTQWRYGLVRFSDLCDYVSKYSLPCVRVDGEEFRQIMYIASLTDDPQKVTSAEWNDIPSHRYISSLEFLSGRPFLKYDDTLGHFVVDAEAIKNNRYLNPLVQNPTPRKTPLPNWSNSVIPSPPQKEADESSPSLLESNPETTSTPN